MVSASRSESVPHTMSSVNIVSHGKVEFGSQPVPKPGPNQVLVKMHSVPINPSDIYFMKGLYTFAQHDYPFTPGWEGAGTVVQAGPGMVPEWLVGKRVAFGKAAEQAGAKWIYGGSMSEYVVTDATSCIPISDDMSFEQASSLRVNPMTALAMLDRIKELRVRSVILTAAASQLGRMMIKLCQKENITPICLVRREAQVQLLQEKHGVKYAVDTSDEDWKK